MLDLDYEEMERSIEAFTRQYNGTAIGASVQNMLDNEIPLEKIYDSIEEYM